MNIILVPGNLSKSRAVQLSPMHLLLLGIALMLLPFLLIVPLYYMTLSSVVQPTAPFAGLSLDARRAETQENRA